MKSSCTVFKHRKTFLTVLSVRGQTSAVFIAPYNSFSWAASMYKIPNSDCVAKKVQVMARWWKSSLNPIWSKCSVYCLHQHKASILITPTPLLKRSAGWNKNDFSFAFTTLAGNVSAQDLHSGLLSRTSAWNEHHQLSIHTVTAVNKWLQDWVPCLTRTSRACPLSWQLHTVLCRRPSGWTWGRSCSPSGYRLSSELPGSLSQWACGDSGWLHFWCGNPGLSVIEKGATMNLCWRAWTLINISSKKLIK